MLQLALNTLGPLAIRWHALRNGRGIVPHGGNSLKQAHFTAAVLPADIIAVLT